MALIDVNDLLVDPDFADSITIIRRTEARNQYGESSVAESSVAAIAVVSNGTPRNLEMLPEGIRLHDVIKVYSNDKLYPQTSGNYSDVVVWQGRRYQVVTLADNSDNCGRGHTVALCVLESVAL